MFDTLNEMRAGCEHVKLHVLPIGAGQSDMLIEKLGGDHGAMHDDLVSKFVCSVCPVEGRDPRPVFLHLPQDYERDRQMRNARWHPSRSGSP